MVVPVVVPAGVVYIVMLVTELVGVEVVVVLVHWFSPVTKVVLQTKQNPGVRRVPGHARFSILFLRVCKHVKTLLLHERGLWFEQSARYRFSNRQSVV